MTAAGDAVRTAVTVRLPVRRAFELFTAGFGSWYPAEYTWSQDVLDRIGIEPRQGVRCFELGPLGFHCDWGRVLSWEPPRRLVLAWRVNARREPVPDPAKASEVEIRFEDDGAATTRVELEHRGFSRHGEDGGSHARAMGSLPGWPYVLKRYAEAAE